MFCTGNFGLAKHQCSTRLNRAYRRNPTHLDPRLDVPKQRARGVARARKHHQDLAGALQLPVGAQRFGAHALELLTVVEQGDLTVEARHLHVGFNNLAPHTLHERLPDRHHQSLLLFRVGGGHGHEVVATPIQAHAHAELGTRARALPQAALEGVGVFVEEFVLGGGVECGDDLVTRTLTRTSLTPKRAEKHRVVDRALALGHQPRRPRLHARHEDLRIAFDHQLQQLRGVEFELVAVGRERA